MCFSTSGLGQLCQVTKLCPYPHNTAFSHVLYKRARWNPIEQKVFRCCLMCKLGVKVGLRCHIPGAGLWDQGLGSDASVGVPTGRTRVQVAAIAVQRCCTGPEYRDRGFGV